MRMITLLLLPEPAQAKWKQDLEWLTQVMLDNYHSDKEQRFYGAIHHKAVMMPDAKHNDFGHTIKAFFSPEWQSKWTQESIPAWQSRPHKHYSSSWEWAELDQAATYRSLLALVHLYRQFAFDERGEPQSVLGRNGCQLFQQRLEQLRVP